MSEPFPKPGARCDLLEPFIDLRIFFPEPAWPDPIDQYALPIGFGRLLVNTFELNAHCPAIAPQVESGCVD